MWWWIALWTTASASEVFSLSADVGAAARYFDDLVTPDPDAFGLSVGARAELDIKLQARLDVRYVEGRAFNPAEDRFFDLSAAISSPAIVICADIHEIYLRESSRRGDDLFYINGGAGFKGRFGRPVTLKGGVGISYLAAASPDGIDQTHALGGYVGADLMVRTRWVDGTLRAATLMAFQESRAYFGLLADGDLTVKIPVGKVALGPRLDVMYRNLGLTDNNDQLFGQKQELTGSLGLAIHWGTGGL